MIETRNFRPDSTAIVQFFRADFEEKSLILSAFFDSFLFKIRFMFVLNVKNDENLIFMFFTNLKFYRFLVLSGLKNTLNIIIFNERTKKRTNYVLLA